MWQINAEELEKRLVHEEKRLRGACYFLVFEQESNQRNRPGGALFRLLCPTDASLIARIPSTAAHAYALLYLPLAA